MRQIKVLYQDEHCAVFDKPSGLIVTPAPHQDQKTLTDIVNDQYASEGSTRLHPCHRLDKETSGVIIYAWGKQNQQRI
ncbi:MAG TPA: pseudouridine synthase, partial [Candidatus Omnitrophota bacterium]|nr:pseudouridine synthase [Candidatus Omnitrophota bacterium]